MPVTPLDALRLTPVRFVLRTTATFRAPAFKGALFRGGFGEFLRMQECSTALPSCSGCPHAAGCLYSRIFETPAGPAQLTKQKFTHAPHPFTLLPPLDTAETIPPGRRLLLHLTLIGEASASLPAIVTALRMMGASGRYGGPFLIESVTSPHTPDGPFHSPPPAWTPSTQANETRAVTQRFLTPLRLRTNGLYNQRPDFHQLWTALLRRLEILLAYYAAAPPDPGWQKPLLDAARRVTTVSSDFEAAPLARRSGRQHATVPMDGVLGALTARGELTPLRPWLEAGTWIGLGSGTSHGLGFYILDSAS